MRTSLISEASQNPVTNGVTLVIALTITSYNLSIMRVTFVKKIIKQTHNPKNRVPKPKKPAIQNREVNFELAGAIGFLLLPRTTAVAPWLRLFFSVE